MTGGTRLSPPAGRAGGGLPEIVSVRPGDEELRQIQALTVIFATTPNAVIREACGFFLSHAAGAAGCHQPPGPAAGAPARWPASVSRSSRPGERAPGADVHGLRDGGSAAVHDVPPGTGPPGRHRGRVPGLRAADSRVRPAAVLGVARCAR